MKLQYDSEIGCFLNSRLQCKGGGSKTTQTTAPNPAQTAILNKQLAIANRLDAQGDLTYYPKQTLASENALIGMGQQGQLDVAQLLNSGLSPDIMGAAQRGLNADLVNDPRTEAYAQAVTRPMEQQFLESTLPSIGSAAVSQGAFGGDRQNVLTNQATRNFNQTLGDTRAKVFADAQRTGMNQQLNILNSLPSIQQGVLTPCKVENKLELMMLERVLSLVNLHLLIQHKELTQFYLVLTLDKTLHPKQVVVVADC